MRLIAFSLIAFLWVGCNTSSSTESESISEEVQPNVLLIMADDMGFSDLGNYGSEISTPNIDRLAAEGTRLKQFYNNTICAPSRASLLTGQYPHKAGIGFFNDDLGYPGYEGYLNKESLTLGEVFKNGGYSTYMAGKWHVGNEKPHWPLQRGFDKFFGFLDGGNSYFDTKPIMKGPPSKAFLYSDNDVYNIDKEDFYLTDELTDRALGYLQNTPEGKPFFLYMAYNSPHWPLHAKPVDIAKYKGKYDAGWDEFRKMRFANLAKMGIAQADWNPVQDQSLPAWNSLSQEEQSAWALKMEIYAAMVDNLDQNIGRLISYLEETNQFDNTMVVFFSDNGAENFDISKMPFVVTRNEGPVGTAGSMESYSKRWAQVSNSPLRSYKSSPYEGGTSTPFIVRYPKQVLAGATVSGGAHVVDIMPTLLSATGVTYPETYNGVKANALAGKSFLPMLKGEAWERGEPICFEWFGDKAVWDGDMKAVALYPDNKWELYDLSKDRTESNNIAASQPETVARIDAIYKAWASKNGALDWTDEMTEASGFRKFPH